MTDNAAWVARIKLADFVLQHFDKYSVDRLLAVGQAYPDDVRAPVETRASYLDTVEYRVRVCDDPVIVVTVFEDHTGDCWGVIVDGIAVHMADLYNLYRGHDEIVGATVRGLVHHCITMHERERDDQ